MRRFLGSGWFFLALLVGGWAAFWWLNAPEGGYANTQGSGFVPMIMTILWPIILASGFARFR